MKSLKAEIIWTATWAVIAAGCMVEVWQFVRQNNHESNSWIILAALILPGSVFFSLHGTWFLTRCMIRKLVACLANNEKSDVDLRQRMRMSGSVTLLWVAIRKAILVIALLLSVYVCMFPPWRTFAGAGLGNGVIVRRMPWTVVETVKNHIPDAVLSRSPDDSIFNPPPPLRVLSADYMSLARTEVDMPELIIALVCIWAGAGAVLVILPNRKNPPAGRSATERTAVAFGTASSQLSGVVYTLATIPQSSEPPKHTPATAPEPSSEPKKTAMTCPSPTPAKTPSQLKPDETGPQNQAEPCKDVWFSNAGPPMAQGVDPFEETRRGRV